MLIDLQGRTAILTGAASGIGKVLALTLAEEGVRLALIDRDAVGLDALKNELDAGGATIFCLPCDVSKGSDVKSAVSKAAELLGGIDILVNNAGVAKGGAIESLEEELWSLNMNVNAKGTFLMSQAVIPYMKRRLRGRIINAASFAAIIPSINSAAYAASKAAVVSFTRVLAGELGPWNITANCYAPGMIPTGMNNFGTLPKERQDQLLDTLTLRRWGDPKDVANLVCFLASDLASYITGALIDVSGGKLATQRPQVAYAGAPPAATGAGSAPGSKDKS